MRRILLFLGIAFILSAGCVKPLPKDIYRKKLIKKIAQMEETYNENKKKIKEAKNDIALQRELRQSQKLLRSRIERLQAQADEETFPKAGAAPKKKSGH